MEVSMSALDLLAKAQELAALPLLEYEALRKSVAKEMGLRPSVLDAEVEKLRIKPETQADSRLTEKLAPAAPQPWAESVDGATLLDSLCDFIRRFVVLDDHAIVAVALWAAFVYFFESAETSPRLRIKSPEKRCGKTRLLELLSVLIPRSNNRLEYES
jgi:putative DNA primase/helicase